MTRNGFLLKTYAQKLQESPGRLQYGDLLMLEEWHRKRLIIIERENHRCQICHQWCPEFPLSSLKKPYSLPMIMAWGGYDITNSTIRDEKTGHNRPLTDEEKLMFKPQSVKLKPNVHHTYYVLNKLPWEYPNESLMLVCHICHKEIHDTQTISIFNDDSLTDGFDGTNCWKCDGSGYLPEYNHVQFGICFSCGGTGYTELSK